MKPKFFIVLLLLFLVKENVTAKKNGIAEIDNILDRLIKSTQKSTKGEYKYNIEFGGDGYRVKMVNGVHSSSNNGDSMDSGSNGSIGDSMNSIDSMDGMDSDNNGNNMDNSGNGDDSNSNEMTNSVDVNGFNSHNGVDSADSIEKSDDSFSDYAINVPTNSQSSSGILDIGNSDSDQSSSGKEFTQSSSGINENEQNQVNSYQEGSLSSKDSSNTLNNNESQGINSSNNDRSHSGNNGDSLDSNNVNSIDSSSSGSSDGINSSSSGSGSINGLNSSDGINGSGIINSETKQSEENSDSSNHINNTNTNNNNNNNSNNINNNIDIGSTLKCDNISESVESCFEAHWYSLCPDQFEEYYKCCFDLIKSINNPNIQNNYYQSVSAFINQMKTLNNRYDLYKMYIQLDGFISELSVDLQLNEFSFFQKKIHQPINILN